MYKLTKVNSHWPTVAPEFKPKIKSTVLKWIPKSKTFSGVDCYVDYKEKKKMDTNLHALTKDPKYEFDLDYYDNEGKTFATEYDEDEIWMLSLKQGYNNSKTMASGLLGKMKQLAQSVNDSDQTIEDYWNKLQLYGHDFGPDHDGND